MGGVVVFAVCPRAGAFGAVDGEVGGATVKRIHADICNAQRYHDFGKAAASGERVKVDVINAWRYRDLDKAAASAERAFAYARDS